MLTCANSSQHTVNLHSTPFADRSVQNASSQHNQFKRKRTKHGMLNDKENKLTITRITSRDKIKKTPAQNIVYRRK